MQEVFTLLSPPLKGLLQESGISAPTPPQVEAIPFIVQGENVLIIAPTGSGKTEAALLPLIDKMVQDENRQGVSLLYITPLRALNRDLLKRLQIWSVKLRFTVEIRHGDTPAADRRRMAGRPPDLLITTPETLQAVLPGTRMRQHLRHVKAVVVDEIHELAGDRRGVQLTVGLERLREARGERFQRVGLSATVGNPEEIARFLGGPESVRIVQIPLSKNAEYKIEYPPPGEADQELAKRLYTAPEAAARLALVSDLVEAHDSTLIFVNSRVNAEMLGSKFNMMDQKIMVHHGSLPKEERVRAEEAFKARQIKGLVCIAHDEPVVTSNGVKSADDVAIGDEVLSYDLESYSTVFRPVTRKFARKADRLVHVKHEFGLLRVTPNHPLLCLGRNGFSWKPAEEIRVGDALVGVGKVEGKKVATNTLISYPNLFVRNSAIAALGYAPPRPYPKAKVTRFLALRSLMRDEDLLRLTEFTTTQTKYTFPPWVDSGLGYLLGFHKSDGDRHLRFFTTDGRKLLQVQYFLSKLHDGSMHRTITPMHRQSFASNRPLMVLQSHSKPLSDLLSNLWSRLPLEASVVAAFLAAYLDGDGCLEIKDGRLENIQFVTFNPINREYLLFAILSMGFKPKLWKANGMSGDGFGISVSYSDDKTRLFQLVKQLSIKANDAGSLDFGNKPKTYYGLGPYLKGVRQNLGISSYKLWKRLNYSTKYEDPARGITCKTLARLNEALDSSLLKHLLQGEFSVSQARAVQTIDGETNVVNFEVGETQTFALTGVITHNCTSTLELGIDIGSVDLVVQYMSPRQVNSLVQRVGRSGHSLARTSQGILVAVSTEDLLESIGVIELAKEGRLEPTVIHRRALDVLAHQIAGLLMDFEGSIPLARVTQVLRRAFPYTQLEDAELEKVVEFMRKMGYLKRDDQTLYRTSRTRMYYYENLSMIPDERRYQVIDLTSQQSVGILGEEFMLTMAHVGLNFIVKGRVWQMKQITDDGKVYVLPVNDPTAAIPGWDGQILPVPGELAVRVGEYRKQIDRLLAEHTSRTPVVEKFSRLWPADPYGVRRVVEEIETHRATGAPVPTNERVLVEGFDRYIIIHTHFGDVLNFTLGEVIEELFRRQGLVRMWWWDSYRILYEMTADTADLDVEDLFMKQVFGVEEPVLGGACHGVLHRHFPWELQMKQIAERFGALSRGRLMYGGAMKELQVRFRLTPIYDETIREAQVERADFEGVKKIFKQIKEQNLEVRFFRSKDKPTPLAYHIIYRHVDIPELIAPENVAADNMARLRISIEGRSIDLLCFDCANLETEVAIRSLSDHPSCQNCDSNLLSPVFWSSAYVASVLRKKRAKQSLDENEQRALTKARRSADLVIAYGRRAVIAQSVYGIGPQTASRVLSKMHESEDEFYRDLLEAKLQFITTRPYWNN